MQKLYMHAKECKRMYIIVAAVWKYIHVENEEII